MANEITHTFMHPADGHLVTYEWHPVVAGQNRLFYESKGFVFVPPAELEEAKAADAELQAELAAKEPEPPRKRGPGRPPK
jgi:hypothetical protein